MSSRPSTVAPPRDPSASASRAVSAAGPPRPRATSRACFTSARRSLRSFDADPSTPSPTRIPASRYSRTGATPAPSRRFEVGQWATPVPDEAKSAVSSAERCTQCAHQTSCPSQPRSVRYSTGVAPYSSMQYASSSRVSARCVCSVSPRRRASSADSVISRLVTENGEHGATAIWTLAPGPVSCSSSTSRSVSASAASMSSTSSSGGRPPSETPRSIDPRDATIRTPSSRAACTSASTSPVLPRGKT